MEEGTDPMQQQQYPQQPYPQEQYPYYYHPRPPPRGADNALIVALVAVVIIAILTPIVMALVFYSPILGDIDGDVVPTGVWGNKIITSRTSWTIEFGKMNREPKPTDLEIMLVKNISDEGIYKFTSNQDGPLTLKSGIPMCTMTYWDLADNEKVNTGDQLRLTNLHPNSDYTIRMLWRRTGDVITSTTFSTPG